MRNGHTAGAVSSAAPALQRQGAGIPTGPLEIGVPKGALDRKLPERQPLRPHGTYQIEDPIPNPCLSGPRCQLAISGSNMDFHLDAATKESRQRKALEKEGKSIKPVPAPEMTKFLKDETPAASRWIREVLVDPAMGTSDVGAWRGPCPDDASASCVTVAASWEEEARVFNTKPEEPQIGDESRAEWRFTTRQMLTHEAAHGRFNNAPPPGMPKFDGTLTRATVSQKELSELFAQLAEFPLFYDEAMSAEGSQKEKVRRVRDSYSERYLQRTTEITENIPGILTRLRCLNPCGELDTMLRTLFGSVTTGWPAAQRLALLTMLTDPAAGLHWPAAPQPAWKLTPEPEELRFEREPLQRKPSDGAVTGEETAIDSVEATLRESGEPLDDVTRRFMESRFSHDFSRVRIHATAHAGHSAQAINAHAYTVGSDMAFAPGRYAPHSDAGRDLLSHELTHVVQQKAAPPK